MCYQQIINMMVNYRTLLATKLQLHSHSLVILLLVTTGLAVLVFLGDLGLLFCY